MKLNCPTSYITHQSQTPTSAIYHQSGGKKLLNQPRFKNMAPAVPPTHYYPKPSMMKNPMTNLLNPEPSKVDRVHNILDTKVIPGAQPSAFGKLSSIKGRDYMTTKGIPGASKIKSFHERDDLKIERSANMRTDDINNKQRDHFQTKAIRNPLDPEYVRLTRSNRYQVIKAEGHKPKPQVSPQTRRYVMRTDDIEGQRTSSSFLGESIRSKKTEMTSLNVGERAESFDRSHQNFGTPSS